MTRNLWRAEWLKTRRSPVNKLIYRALLFMIFLGYVIITAITLTDREEQIGPASGTLPFPFAPAAMNSTFLELGPILAMIFIAASVGHEYTRDTWKMVIPRYGSRSAFLLTKLVSALLGLMIMLLSLLGISTITGMLCSLVLGIDPVRSEALTSHLLTQQLTIAGLAMLVSIFFGLLTLLLTVLSRSTITGVGAGFILLLLGEGLAAGLGALWKPLAQAWPLPHITNLKAAWIDEMAWRQASVDFIFRGDVSTAQSLVTLLAYMLVFVAGAFYLFKRRDMAG